jgi:SAM-dependent methyltransferase
MKIELLELLRCPKTGQRLRLERVGDFSQDAEEGWLVSDNSQYRYPIHYGIPRFVTESNYADNFGMQWNHFRQTQLDSCSGHPISADRFWKATGWLPSDLKDQWVLDVGCGAGRFAEVVLNAGARIVALDYSGAVDACNANLKQHTNLHGVQGDIYALPFARESFSFVYCLGVLQHTPNVAEAFAALPLKLREGGKLCVDFYWKRFRTMMHSKYLLRLITKHLSHKRLFVFLEGSVPLLLTVSQGLGRVPLIGRVLKRMVPVADYTGIYPLSDKQLKEWALLDTFDMLAPQYDNPQTAATARQWMEQAGMQEIEILTTGPLVARGKK